MSTTPTLERHQAASSPTPERPQFELSATAVVAGALAALTSAFLGSQLGTAGTIAGAAVGSTIGAVATALYSYGLRHTKHTVATLAQRTRSLSTQGPPEDDVEPLDPSGSDSAPARKRRGVGRVTAIVGVLLAAVVAFVVALVVITGIEVGTGHSFDGGTGTSVSRVATGSTEVDAGDASATDDATSASDTPSETAESPDPAVTSATPESTPSTTEANAEPTPTPTPSSTPLATTTPMAPSAPSGEG